MTWGGACHRTTVHHSHPDTNATAAEASHGHRSGAPKVRGRGKRGGHEVPTTPPQGVGWFVLCSFSFV